MAALKPAIRAVELPRPKRGKGQDGLMRRREFRSRAKRFSGVKAESCHCLVAASQSWLRTVHQIELIYIDCRLL